MMHNGRIFHVTATGKRQELVERLIRGKMNLCSGIYHDGLLFLNDSQYDAGDRRFAIMRAERAPEPGRWELDQISTLSVSQYTDEQLSRIIDGYSQALPSGRVIVQIDGVNHLCPLCA